MPLPRVRFTVRRLMVAVAIVGVVVGGYGMIGRRRAAFHAVAKRQWIASINADRNAATSGSEARIKWAARKRWHEAMIAKYQWAARHPFLPVAPDPPEPE